MKLHFDKWFYFALLTRGILSVLTVFETILLGSTFEFIQIIIYLGEETFGFDAMLWNYQCLSILFFFICTPVNLQSLTNLKICEHNTQVNYGIHSCCKLWIVLKCCWDKENRVGTYKERILCKKSWDKRPVRFCL